VLSRRLPVGAKRSGHWRRKEERRLPCIELLARSLRIIRLEGAATPSTNDNNRHDKPPPIGARARRCDTEIFERRRAAPRQAGTPERLVVDLAVHDDAPSTAVVRASLDGAVAGHDVDVAPVGGVLRQYGDVVSHVSFSFWCPSLPPDDPAAFEGNATLRTDMSFSFHIKEHYDFFLSRRRERQDGVWRRRRVARACASCGDLKTAAGSRARISLCTCCFVGRYISGGSGRSGC